MSEKEMDLKEKNLRQVYYPKQNMLNQLEALDQVFIHEYEKHNPWNNIIQGYNVQQKRREEDERISNMKRMTQQYQDMAMERQKNYKSIHS